MIDERVVVFISFIIFMVVEESIFLPLKADLINLLPSSNKQVHIMFVLHITFFAVYSITRDNHPDFLN